MLGFVTELKDWISIIQGVATISAIGAGAYWFFQRRQKFPRAEIRQSVQSWKLPDGKWLLRVEVEIRNAGEVLLELEHSFSRVQQMRPWPQQIDPPPEHASDRKTEVEWPMLKEMTVDFEGQERAVEPGEVDTVPHEFVLPSDAEMVVVYSYFRNKTKRFKSHPFASTQKEVGWCATSIHELKTKTH